MSGHSQRSTGKQKGHPHSAKLAGAALLIGVPQDWFVRIKGKIRETRMIIRPPAEGPMILAI